MAVIGLAELHAVLHDARGGAHLDDSVLGDFDFVDDDSFSEHI